MYEITSTMKMNGGNKLPFKWRYSVNEIIAVRPFLVHPDMQRDLFSQLESKNNVHRTWSHIQQCII